MAPAAVKKSPAVGRRKKGNQEEEDDDDDEALLEASQGGQWTDSFIVLSFGRWLLESAFQLLPSSGSKEDGAAAGAGDGAAGSATGAKKGKAKEASANGTKGLIDKEAAMEQMSKCKIPLGLLAASVLTCALIIGGENFGEREDRGREAVEDFYGVLGVTRDAESADVKRAYKTLARRWHPDKNPNCSSCQETFSKIATAYETLSDDKRRAAYDESGGVATNELKSPRSVPLTRENFDQLVTFSNDVWIVQIFKPEDASCAQFHPFWENQIQKHGHLVRFGRVDVTNDLGKWLPVKYRYLPTILKFGRHLGSPEIFPITAMHETPQVLMKFVLTSFPNIGLPLHTDPGALKRWVRSSGRRHKVLLAIPGRSEDERYKSHLVPRKMASRWSELFEFRTAETAALHKLSNDHVSPEVKAALPPSNESSDKAAIVFWAASGPATPQTSVIVAWPTTEDDLVMELLALAELAVPALSARSSDLLCRSLAIRRVYCLVLVDPTDAMVNKAVKELRGSRAQYRSEVDEIRSGGGEVAEDEDNFIVPAVRLFRRARGLQASLATCRAPKFAQVDQALEGTTAWLMDLDTGRFAALKGLTSFQGIYPRIAYEESLTWVEGVLHPYLSLPDCDEGLLEHFVRGVRAAPVWMLLVQLLTAIFLAEAIGKAVLEQSPKWGAGAGCLVLLMLLRSPPFLRWASSYLPGALFSPPLLVSD